MRLLLISNSGFPLYGWCKKFISDFVGDEKEIAFVSSATVFDTNGYFEAAKAALEEVGLRLEHLDLENNPESLLEKSKTIIVGGGNTYHLLKELKEHQLIEKIKSRVKDGLFYYIGLSAGANIVGPNILTTNDWNVEGSTAFEGLNLVPFNINPHYIDPHDKSTFSGESHDDRINEYFTFNDNPVIAFEEKTFLSVEDLNMTVGGFGKVKLFAKNKESKIYKPNDEFQLP